jgi:hypothetical protein
MIHTHDWKPIPNECGRYACACSAVGRRERGGIVSYAKSPQALLDAAKPYPAAARISHFTPDERAERRTERLPDPRWRNPGVVR